MMRWIKEERILQLLGPVCLLSAIALSPLNFPLALLGLTLSLSLRMRGFAYALIALAVGAFFFHGFYTTHHITQIALEISLALSFLVVAQVQEEETTERTTINEKLEAHRSTQAHLEEELVKTQEEKQRAQIGSDARINTLQTELDETEKEQSSLFILNEVLRKTAARHIEEKQELEKEAIDLQRRIALMQQDISRFEQAPPPRDDLMKELNAARIAREQTHLINETLARLHAQKHQELEEAKAKNEEMKAEFQSVYEQKCKELEEFRLEPPLPSAPSPVELLYNQLRKQFEEKSQVLHETRKDLFRKETELETLRLDKEPIIDPLVKPMQQEIDDLANETAELKEENKELQELISAMMAVKPELQEEPSTKRKKKAPKPRPPELMVAMSLF